MGGTPTVVRGHIEASIIEVSRCVLTSMNVHSSTSLYRDNKY